MRSDSSCSSLRPFSRDRHGFHSAANTQVLNETCQVQGAQHLCPPHLDLLFFHRLDPNPLSLAWTVNLCLMEFDKKDLQTVKLHFASHLKEKLCLCLGFQLQIISNRNVLPMYFSPGLLAYKWYSTVLKHLASTTSLFASTRLILPFFRELHTYLGVLLIWPHESVLTAKCMKSHYFHPLAFNSWF